VYSKLCCQGQYWLQNALINQGSGINRLINVTEVCIMELICQLLNSYVFVLRVHGFKGKQFCPFTQLCSELSLQMAFVEAF
jgi:hypothetical protein